MTSISSIDNEKTEIEIIQQKKANQLKKIEQLKNETEEERIKREEKEWKEVEDLIILYQKQFDENHNKEDIIKAKEAMNDLLDRFYPLFRKYFLIITTGNFNYHDFESKLFIRLFINNASLINILKSRNISNTNFQRIKKSFNFIVINYGSLEPDEIITDLQIIFMKQAKKYKTIGRGFCAYLFNSYRYAVARHIKKHLKNPINIQYKNLPYEDSLHVLHLKDLITENDYEEHYYENKLGIPDISWIKGQSCEELFEELSVFERKILVKYYLEMYNDRQIAEEFGIHINTINNNRRHAIEIIAKKLNIDPNTIKRSRRSGRKAILSTI